MNHKVYIVSVLRLAGLPHAPPAVHQMNSKGVARIVATYESNFSVKLQPNFVLISWILT
jgi:hypothetical protein